MPRTITRDELQASLATPAAPVLLEALPAKYYLDGHLPGALHMPHDRVTALARDIIPNSQAEIVVYCASDTCRNSHIAAQALARLGYGNVSIYAGGKKDWMEAGLPVEQGGTVQAAA